MSTVVLTAEIASPFAGLLGAWRLLAWWHRRRWLRCLANIKRLEIATGIVPVAAQKTVVGFGGPTLASVQAQMQARHDELAAATTKEANPELYAEMVKRGLR